ncbi:MAG: DUF4424 family protein, partial [Xanthobacteraceae bacterium]
MRLRCPSLALASSFLLLIAGFQAAQANDSAAELSVGGLTFTKSADISIESEELTITPDLVT